MKPEPLVIFCAVWASCFGCLGDDSGVDEVGVGGAGFFVVDVAEGELDGLVELGPSLDGGGAADEGAGLDVGEERGGCAFGEEPRRAS